MPERKLTPKQERFIDEYLKDLNAAQAAIRAGYSERRAGEIGYQLLQKNPIAEEISKRKKALAENCSITLDRIVKEMARLALFNIKSLFDDDGNPMPISKLSDDAAAAVVGLDVVTVGNSELGVGQVMKYKIPDKNKALENLAKILGYMDRERARGQDSNLILAKAMTEFAQRINNC